MIYLVVGGLFLLTLPFLLRSYTALRFADDIYSVEKVPQRRAAIIFGARVLPSGRLSAMLADRVAAGADLYHQGKVDVLLLTGDARTADYNEPAAMLRHALNLGVPQEAILIDGAGLRTYESCYRAREVYQLDTAILVTQDFHLDRALLLCRGLGLDAVGVAADYQRPWGYSSRSMRFSVWREIPATTMAVLDLLRWKVGG